MIQVNGKLRGSLKVAADADKATIEAAAGQVRIELDEPAFGIAPGQAAVYYDGDRVVGSATITAAS